MTDAAETIVENEVEDLTHQELSADTVTLQAPLTSHPFDNTTGKIPASSIGRQLEHATTALTSTEGPRTVPKAGIAPFEPAEFQETPPSTEKPTLTVVHDVELNLSFELGRTNMFLEDVLKLQRGAVIPLDKLAGDPIDIFVNGRLVARGEVLVLNDNFCVRVAELISGD